MRNFRILEDRRNFERLRNKCRNTKKLDVTRSIGDFGIEHGIHYKFMKSGVKNVVFRGINSRVDLQMISRVVLTMESGVSRDLSSYLVSVFPISSLERLKIAESILEEL